MELKLVLESGQKFKDKLRLKSEENHKFELNDRRKQIAGFKKKKSYKEEEKNQ
jgi:hypothetical protein